MKNGFDGVNLDGRERSDLDDRARIAQLECEVLALRANGAIQEQIIKDGGNPFLKDKLVRLILENTMLKSRNGEAMELLDLAIADILQLDSRPCELCKFRNATWIIPENCKDCDSQGKRYTNWKWQHADRYEALKAQSGASGSGADGEEQK